MSRPLTGQLTPHTLHAVAPVTPATLDQEHFTPLRRILADSIAKAEQLALDAPIAPARVLPGQLAHQLAHLVWTGGRPTAFGYVHFLLTRRRCQPSSVPGVTIRYSRRRPGSSRATAAITARSAQSGLGRAT